MDSHGQRSTSYSSSESQVHGGKKSDNSDLEEDMIATTTITAPQLVFKEDATECSFRSFEVAKATNTKDRSKTPMSHLSQNTRMILRQTVGK